MMRKRQFWTWSMVTKGSLEAEDDAWLLGFQRGVVRGGESAVAKLWPKTPPVWVATKMPHAYDAMFGSSGQVISNRLRKFLEMEAPGVVAFYPLSIKGLPAPAEQDGPFWFMRFTRRLDCLNRERSMSIDEDGKEFVQVPVIDPAKVPEDFVVGVVSNRLNELFISNDLRLKLAKAGFTGIKPMKCYQSDAAPTFRTLDYSKGGEPEYRKAVAKGKVAKTRKKAGGSKKVNASKGRLLKKKGPARKR